jgi:DNA-directed RNA polymerase subunit beta'
LTAKFDGIIQFDGVRVTSGVDESGEKINVVIGRTGEVRIVKEDNPDKVLSQPHSLRFYQIL